MSENLGQELQELWDQGIRNPYALAQCLGTSQKQVYRLLRKGGIRRKEPLLAERPTGRGARKALLDKLAVNADTPRNREIARLYDEGYTQAVIGELFGITRAQVSNILYMLRDREKPSSDLVNLRQACDTLNCWLGDIKSALAALGIPTTERFFHGHRQICIPVNELPAIEEYVTWLRENKEILRITERVQVTEGCWLWQGATPGAGYGRVHYQGKIMGAHVAIWQLCFGDIPDGLWVLHTCDNPPCVNPDHLFLGTPADNVHDAIQKGRWKHQRLAGQPNRLEERFSDEDLAAMKYSYHELGVPMWQIAKEFGISAQSVKKIVGMSALPEGMRQRLTPADKVKRRKEAKRAYARIRAEARRISGLPCRTFEELSREERAVFLAQTAEQATMDLQASG